MKVKIKNIGKVVTGKTPSTSNSANFGEGYSFITPADLHIDDGVVKYTKRTITQKGFNSIKNNTISGLSILVGCIGWDMGNVALVNGKCATNQQINSITDINYELYNHYYIYYWLKLHKNFLFKLANVTRTPILKKSDFENIEIEIPNIKVQNTTAGLLRTIDSKIANNNAISKELESMAKTIYNYWFLQFEFPDKDGKPYKSNGGKMVWNEQLKQEIPEGWEVKKLSSVEPNIVTGKTPSTKDESNFGNDVPFVCIGDIRDHCFINETDISLSIKGANLQSNKYIPQGSLCISCIATPGLIGFVSQKSQTNQQINSIVFKNNTNKYFLYFNIKEYFNSAKVVKSGNTFANMNKQEFSSIPVLYNASVIKMFYDVAEPIFNKVELCERENQQLKSLRDFLLPLLMNGQVVICD